MSAELGPELRGAVGVRRDVAEFYREWLPKHAGGCSQAWGVPVEVPVSRPDDKRADAYFDRDPAALDRWPLLSVSTGRRTLTEQDRALDGEPVITSTYPVRVFTWVRNSGWDATQDARDNLAAAVQITTLAHRSMESDHLHVVASTLVVDVSNVEAVTGDRFVAGSFVGFDLRVVETLTDRLTLPTMPGQDRVGTVDSVSVSGRVLPPLGG